MRTKKIAIALLALGAWLAPGSDALGASTPAWQLTSTPLPTHFAPGSEDNEVFLVAVNVGAAPTSGPVTITDTLPAGLTPTSAAVRNNDPASTPSPCEVNPPTVTCPAPVPVGAGRQLEVRISADVDPLAPEDVLFDEARIEGGGGLPVSIAGALPISSTPASFGFLLGAAGLSAPLTGPDGAAVTQAGSHPHQLTVNVGFPTEEGPVGAGHLHGAGSDLPRGMVINPAATPVLCTEAQLLTEDFADTGCPHASQVGTASVLTQAATVEASTAPLYNMVPPPGTPASLGFNAAGAGIMAHIIGSVRTDGDYGLTGASNDIIALVNNPVFGVRLDLWGKPSDPSHDKVRGNCFFDKSAVSCPVEPSEEALLTLPTQCTGKPSITRAFADSWEEPGIFKEASYESADLAGNPVSVDGCNALQFKPTIKATPTTNLAESPTGLDFNLHQPQDNDFESLSTAPVKDITIALPEGMTLNPSAADGIAGCTSEQIGLKTAIGESPIHISKEPPSCPDASRLGTVKVRTPALAQYVSEQRTVVDPKTEEAQSIEETKFEIDPETGKPIPDPVSGSVYLAQPFDNPFGSLLAIYLTIEDQKTGIIAKVPAKITADPNTGQLVTQITENPQLPIEDVDVHFSGGARAPLITPPLCGTHTTTSTMTPWSSPEGADAHPGDSFATSASPSGGNCPTSAGGAPNKPAFSAGTIAPQAGAYSPFVLKLSREDGSQRLKGVEATLPPGLSGKLAGVGTCSETQIAQAIARSHPNEGALEKASPSCPASSEVGVVSVGAGAGPTPFYVQGHAYLAGPYKGAPLSMAIVTPAVAGPFDLGAVLVRSALYVDPETAQIHAVSDPLPQILEGIPLDVRSIALRMDRPSFTLNPTSCDPMAINGTLTSALGQGASLASPFQVGGCSSLPFKPKLSLKLKGGTKRAGHPKLIATLKAKPGEANIAKASVQLPRSAFLDQAHIRTVCTRVQFAADACPKGSIYGTASASTPLLADPLTGNVYLRSSSHKLPDLLVALKGPESLPIEIDLDGKTDSVKGALRNSFEAVPDAPVSKFRLELFGGKRGLVINSRDLCAHAYRATIVMEGQNGKVFDSSPAVGSDCGKRRGHGRHHKRGRDRHS